jgi:WD40-like Beta Propeller Repeat
LLTAGASGAGAVLLGVILAVLGPRPPATAASDRPLLRLEVELRSGAELGSVVGTDVIISPDGSRLVFVATDSDAVSHLYTRDLKQSNILQMPGTDGARAPFFSPDGQWVGFWASGKLNKAPIDGGVPIVLCEAADLLGASWGDDGNIIAVLNSSARLWRIPAAGGTPAPLLDPPAGVDRQVYPQVLPGAKAVLLTAIGSRGESVGESVEARAGRAVWKGAAKHLQHMVGKRHKRWAPCRMFRASRSVDRQDPTWRLPVCLDYFGILRQTIDSGLQARVVRPILGPRPHVIVRRAPGMTYGMR